MTEHKHRNTQNVTVVSLRRRARYLRRQALRLQQRFVDGRGELVTADVVHEVVALREESRELDCLAGWYERAPCPVD